MRRFAGWALFYGLLHYASLFLLEGIIFLLAHLPPRFVSIDAVILAATWIGRVLVLPRLWLRELWPVESSGFLLRVFLSVINSLIWGIALTALLRWRPAENRV